MKITGHRPDFLIPFLPKEKDNLLATNSSMQEESPTKKTINLGILKIRYDKAQHAKLASKLAENVTEKNKEEIMEKLIGESINPNKITKKMMREINFDGIGRIESFRPGVTPDMLNVLVRNKIKALTETPSPLAGEMRKSGRGCMLEFMHALNGQDNPAAQALAIEAKNLWLSGKLDQASVTDFFKQVGVRADLEPQLHVLAEKLQDAITKPKVASQFCDNIYGRKFESAFVYELIKNPPAQLLTTTAKVGDTLLCWLMENIIPTLPEDDQAELLDSFASEIFKDKRPWFSETPEVNAFVENPTLDNLRPLFEKVENGFDAIKIPYLCVRFMITADPLGILPPWMDEANTSFEEVVEKTRSVELNEVQDADYNGYGLRLPHHPKYETIPGFQAGTNWAIAKKMQLDNPTEFEKNSLKYEHPVVCSVSGSTNIMAHFNQHIADNDSEFSQQQSQLCTLMFSVFDGGHSANEVMVVANAIETEPWDQDKDLDEIIKDRKDITENYNLDYNDIIKLGIQDGTHNEISQALDLALANTVKYYEESQLT